MPFDLNEALRTAAKRANRATNAVMKMYEDENAVDEDDVTGVLVGRLSAALEGDIDGLTWKASIARHRRGEAAQEKLIGADLIIHVKLDTPKLKYSKGVLVQSKRIDIDSAMSPAKHNELVRQCKKMLAISPHAHVFNYTTSSMRCAPAVRVAGSTDRVLSNDCIWTSYRFFLELFRCPVGDPKITSASPKQIIAEHGLELIGRRSE